MPRGDRTGPFGEGPKTGRQLGYCAGYDHPGFAHNQPDWRRGFGRQFRGGTGFAGGPGLGRGAGFRFRHGWDLDSRTEFADVSEKTLIENEIRILKDQLSSLEDRLSKME